MALQSIVYLKGRFETGDIPTEQDFIDLFDSYLHYTRIVQTSGASITDVMSQDAVSDLVVAAMASANAYADGLVVGLWDDRGNYDASGGAYPSSGGSGTAGVVMKGDIWTVSVAGTLPTGQIVEVGATVRAKQDTPGNIQANWAILQNNLGYISENQANKENTTLDTSTTKYPTNRLVKEYVDNATPPDATNSVKGIAKLFPSADYTTPRTDGALDEVSTLNEILNNSYISQT